MSGTVLVLADHVAGAVGATTLQLLTLARRGGEPAAVLLGGADLPAYADQARQVLGRFGAGTVHTVAAAELADDLVAPAVDALEAVVRAAAPTAVLVPSTLRGKELAGRLAVRLGSGIITDAVDVTADLTTTQSVFAGSYEVQARVTRGTPVITVKPNAATAEEAPVEAVLAPVGVAFGAGAAAVRVSERTPRERGGRPPLAEAPVVVAGGRGTGGDFAPLEELADALGGAVGASRAAVDAGWYPHAHQIGQTGLTVSPQLYVACGISGAIQHRSGMQASGTIVAVNKDAEAPIFAIADLGIVGDVATVLPQAVAELRRRRG